jgi:hypothetical protein
MHDVTDGVWLGNEIGKWVATNHFQPVPEPSSLTLALLATIGLLRKRR